MGVTSSQHDQIKRHVLPTSDYALGQFKILDSFRDEVLLCLY
jgi:hypothetical protein